MLTNLKKTIQRQTSSFSCMEAAAERLALGDDEIRDAILDELEDANPEDVDAVIDKLIDEFPEADTDYVTDDNLEFKEDQLVEDEPESRNIGEDEIDEYIENELPESTVI